MNAIAELQPPRLPYHAAVQDRFGVDKSGWKALVEAVYPLAKTPDSVVMALSYCKARKLDPFKKPVHIVPMWDSKKRAYVETIWPGISEVRTTAFRTGQYAGCDEAEFGPTIEKTFTGKVKKGDNYEEQTVEVAFPEWCRMTVYRTLGDRVCKFVGPKVKWLESYATIGNTDLPNDMWQSRPEGQIEKCAEAASLRKAFPEELGNQLTAEEMEGRRVEGDVADAEVAEVTQRRLPPAPTAARQIARVQDAQHDLTGEIDQGEAATEQQAEEAKPVRQPPKPAETKAEATKVTSGRAAQKSTEVTPEDKLDQIKAILEAATSPANLEQVLASDARPIFDTLSEADQKRAIKLYEAVLARLMDAGDDGEGQQTDEQAYDPAPILADIQRLFDDCDSDERLALVFERQVLPLIPRLSLSDREKAKHIYNLAQKRILEADAGEAGDPVGPDERGHPEDDSFPGDKPSKAAAPTEKKPEKMDAAELEAHIRGYIETMSDADALKKRWYGDDENREILSDKVRQELRSLWKARTEELRTAEGQA